MARVEVKIKGGDKLAKHLSAMAARMAGGGVVRVGFLENATYPAGPNGKSLHVAQVAFWDEWGTSTSKPRPFFRNMIEAESPTWGKKLAAITKATGYDGPRSLALMGTLIRDQLVKSIVDWPADNAPSTVSKKGFNKGLVDKGVMQRAPDFEVVR